MSSAIENRMIAPATAERRETDFPCEPVFITSFCNIIRITPHYTEVGEQLPTFQEPLEILPSIRSRPFLVPLCLSANLIKKGLREFPIATDFFQEIAKQQSKAKNCATFW